MALKFRKRMKLFPGFYLNLSKSGMSATVGMRGFSMNVGKKGTYLNTGIPGTGLYDRQRIDSGANNSNAPALNPLPQPESQVPIPEGAEIKSFEPELITSEGLYGLKESIISAQKEKADLLIESKKAAKSKLLAQVLLGFSYALIFGFFIPKIRQNAKDKAQAALEAREEYETFKLDIEMNLDPSIQNDYLILKKSFEDLVNIDTIWDVTSASAVNRAATRSAAGTTVTRTKVIFGKGSLDYIATPFEALKFHNANGGDIFLYPGFMVMAGRNSTDFALIDFRDLEVEHNSVKFLETDRIPKDTKVIDKTWKYVNKNGQPDRRFKENPEIPIVHYYELTLKTDKGLHESYLFSNPEIADKLCTALNVYKTALQKMTWAGEKAA
jgi:hypothetical protein